MKKPKNHHRRKTRKSIAIPANTNKGVQNSISHPHALPKDIPKTKRALIVNRKALTIGMLSIILVSIAWVGSFWLLEPARVIFKGKLESIDSIKAGFSTEPENGISLGCGCMHPNGADYRGIGVVSNQLVISGGNDYGAFSLFATHPGPTSIMPELSFEGMVYQIAVDGYQKKIDSQQMHEPEAWRQKTPFVKFSPENLGGLQNEVQHRTSGKVWPWNPSTSI